jgi:hypothetical protein
MKMMIRSSSFALLLCSLVNVSRDDDGYVIASALATQPDGGSAAMRARDAGQAHHQRELKQRDVDRSGDGELKRQLNRMFPQDGGQ